VSLRFSEMSEQRRRELKKVLCEPLHSVTESFATDTLNMQRHRTEAIRCTIRAFALLPVEAPASTDAVQQLAELKNLIDTTMIQSFPGIDNLASWPKVSKDLTDSLALMQSSDQHRLFKQALSAGEFEKVKASIRIAVMPGLVAQWGTLNNTGRLKWIQKGGFTNEFKFTEIVFEAYLFTLPPLYLENQEKVVLQFSLGVLELDPIVSAEAMEYAKRKNEESRRNIEQQVRDTQERVGNPEGSPAPLSVPK
jgi:hypothetical protein